MVEASWSPSHQLPLQAGSDSDDCEAGEQEFRQGESSAGCGRRRSLWLAASSLGLLAALAVAIRASASRAPPATGRLAREHLGHSSGASFISLDLIGLPGGLPGIPGIGGGGDVKEDYNCDTDLAAWQQKWSPEKKRWCCTNKRLGCPPVNQGSITFVVANINFQTITSAKHKDVLDSFLATVLEDVVEKAQHEVKPANVSLSYWEGTANPVGIVIRASLTVAKKDLVATVLSQFHEEGPGFLTKVAQDVSKVKGIHKVSTPPISVQDFVIDRAEAQQNCTCDHGEKQDGEGCPVGGGEVCKSCYTGFHLTASNFCAPNECSCPNGYKATGELCDAHESTKCSSCELGHHMDNDAQTACVPNECTCANGTGATGRACYMHEGSICADCREGFHVDRDSWTCKANECQCEFGFAVVGKDCTKPGANICKTCEKGYHEVDGKCERNVCQCDLGEAALGHLCETHGASVCVYCREGLHLHSDGTCGEKQCLCPNGVGARGDVCEEHRSVQCASCDEGYHLNANQCLNQGCACEGGVAASGIDCLKHILYPPEGEEASASLCASCNPGNSLIDGDCVPNTCTCDNGEPAVGADCLAPGAHSCGKCDAGFHANWKNGEDADGAKSAQLNSSTPRICVQNVCTCQYNGTEVGTPASMGTVPACLTQGNVCVDCMAFGYQKVGDQCMPNECTCTGGKPVGAGKCPFNNTEFCESCDDGYFNTTEPLTEWEKKEGTPPDASKYQDGAMICIKDAFTTTLPFECAPQPIDWEMKWSANKKDWCCKNQEIGCTPNAKEKELCINDTMVQTECEKVGCCSWDEAESKCAPAHSPGERVCHPVFNVKISGGTCLTAETATGNSSDSRNVELQACDPRRRGQAWKPEAHGQIKDLHNLCLKAKPDEDNGKLIMANCSETDEAQVFVRDPLTMQLRSKKGYCITSQGALAILETCQEVNTNQQWIVPQVNR
mmetsp:Transcript_82855/g.208719  ORF Transcript_82855/g.208719 Transcript_82855/m.208719 type:complete len:957 (-) Transcript_82855:157-3027(-)